MSTCRTIGMYCGTWWTRRVARVKSRPTVQRRSPPFAKSEEIGRISGMRTFVAGLLAIATTAGAQTTVQYTSPAGVEYRSQVDTGTVKRAQAALDADPKNPQRYIDLGVAQSGVRQFREAIVTFTKGLAIAPNNALLYRWRGHRYLSTRQFDLAVADFNKGLTIDSTVYGIW